MNRRGFLKLLGGAAIIAAAPTYFLPPIGGWKSDVIINPTISEYADYASFSSLSLKTSIESMIQFYSARMIENLKENSPLLEICKDYSIPEGVLSKTELYMYQPLGPNA